MPAVTRPISSLYSSMPDGACRRAVTIAVFMLGAASCGLAMAADASTDAEARYQSERAACLRGQSAEDQETCLREAAAARKAARQGKLDTSQDVYEKNALARCEALPQADRDICRRRTRGEGTTTGSVSGGGILREYKEITLPSLKTQDDMPKEPPLTLTPGTPMDSSGDSQPEGK